MSLITDKKFFEILRNDERITARVGKNIKNTVSVRSETSIPPIPLILVCYQGMTNRYESKDDEFDTSIDDVNIEIVVAHESREKLGELIHLCRVVIGEYISNNPNEDLIPIDYQISASGVSYDSLRPCYLQSLNYACETRF